MRVLLDSSAYSQLMRGCEQVSRIVQGVEEALLSAVVLAELLHGFRHGSRYERNIPADAGFPRQSVRLTRAGRSRHCGSLLDDRGLTPCLGPSRSHQRHLDRGSRHGDRG